MRPLLTEQRVPFIETDDDGFGPYEFTRYEDWWRAECPAHNEVVEAEAAPNDTLDFCEACQAEVENRKHLIYLPDRSPHEDRERRERINSITGVPRG